MFLFFRVLLFVINELEENRSGCGGGNFRGCCGDWGKFSVLKWDCVRGGGESCM